MDGDGASGGDGGEDCDDSNDAIYPGAEETCDGVDGDCDGYIDDDDKDGFTELGCGDEGDDCNDEDSAVYPGADELPYDGVDQDCDGADLTDVDEDGEDWLGVEGGTGCDDNSARLTSPDEVYITPGTFLMGNEEGQL